MPQIDLSCKPCCNSGAPFACGTCFPNMFPDGDPPFLYGTITDATGDFAGSESAQGFALQGAYDWLSEDFEPGCAIGSARFYCEDDVLYFEMFGDPNQTFTATEITCDPLEVVFEVSVDEVDCVGTFPSPSPSNATVQEL